MAQAVIVRPVKTGSELKSFMKLPWKFGKDDPNFVPPMLFDVNRRLSPKENPYFEHAEAELFVAWRGSEPVGRISAQKDQNYDKHWGGKTGHFGWFECENDPAAAKALFDAAADWLKKKDRDKMQGPYSFNINDETGILIDGFDTPPMCLMTHNPPYYPALCDGYGFGKAQDLFAYRMDATADAPPDVAKYAEMIRQKEGIVIRQWNLKDFKREMKLFHEVYNSAWEQNWGMVQLTENELNAYTTELRMLVDPRISFFAETKDGQVMGASLSLPNFNEYFVKANGHIWGLFPFAWYGLIVSKKYRSLRVFALGVKKEFRKSGVGAVFYYDTLMAAKRLGIQWGEMSWILESNDAMNRAIQHMGGKVYKTYRIYEKAI